MIEEEIWLPVVGAEDKYHVSNLGRIKSLEIRKLRSDGRRYYRDERILELSVNKGGYAVANIKIPGSSLVHRIVMDAFMPTEDNSLEINHLDENKLNNRLDNLEWCTHQYNNNYGSKPEKMHNALVGHKVGRKLTDEQVAQVRFLYESGGKGVRELGRMFNVSHTLILRVVNHQCFY